ncbi:MAG: ogr/Delta-like zinc finger family protein [Neisseriaceae bacterium]|nr:ogr/Delta-like zinc finger family protein [Neisseriaceae bacterium]MBR3425804.1 ogr/Delta-like zinc finger family protein [Neisseriaceae bacterium]
MAHGMTCPRCGMPMYAKREDEQPKGSWVYYQCTNGNCKFETKEYEEKKR